MATARSRPTPAGSGRRLFLRFHVAASGRGPAVLLQQPERVTGTPSPFSGSNSRSNFENNFLVAMFCTTNAHVTGNTVTDSSPSDPLASSAFYFGGGDWNSTIANNTLNGDGASDASGINLNDRTSTTASIFPGIRSRHGVEPRRRWLDLTASRWSTMAPWSNAFSVNSGTPWRTRPRPAFTVGGSSDGERRPSSATPSRASGTLGVGCARLRRQVQWFGNIGHGQQLGRQRRDYQPARRALWSRPTIPRRFLRGRDRSGLVHRRHRCQLWFGPPGAGAIHDHSGGRQRRRERRGHLRPVPAPTPRA